MKKALILLLVLIISIQLNTLFIIGESDDDCSIYDELDDDEIETSDTEYACVASSLEEFIKEIPNLPPDAYNAVFQCNDFFLAPDYDADIIRISISRIPITSWNLHMNYKYRDKTCFLSRENEIPAYLSDFICEAENGIYYVDRSDDKIHDLYKTVDGELMCISVYPSVTPDEINDYKDLFNLKRYYYDDSVDIVEPIEPRDCACESYKV